MVETVQVINPITANSVLFKNNNTGPKAINVLQQKKNKHTNTE